MQICNNKLVIEMGTLFLYQLCIREGDFKFQESPFHEINIFEISSIIKPVELFT